MIRIGYDRLAFRLVGVVNFVGKFSLAARLPRPVGGIAIFEDEQRSEDERIARGSRGKGEN
jgi:hypothetical protein